MESAVTETITSKTVIIRKLRQLKRRVFLAVFGQL